MPAGMIVSSNIELYATELHMIIQYEVGPKTKQASSKAINSF